MKSVRNRNVANSSFLSNHDLLQNFRNKSFKLITRQSSYSQLKQVPKKISLIQKKNYQPKTIQNKQNESLLSNRKEIPVTKRQTQRQKTTPQLGYDIQVQKVIKQLNFIYDQINTEEIQLKMILNKNIRKIKQLFFSQVENISNKNLNDANKQLKENIDTLNQKVQTQSKKIFKYKKQCEQSKEKLSLYETQIQKLQESLDQQRQINLKNISQQKGQIAKETILSSIHVRKSHQNNLKLLTDENQLKQKGKKQNQIEILQNIIQTQQQLIQKQMTDFEAQNEQFLRLLQTQAFQIEQMVKHTQKSNENFSSKQYLNHQKSTGFQSRYNSNSSTHFNSINHFTTFNSPQKTENLITKINKIKPKQGQFSICLY